MNLMISDDELFEDLKKFLEPELMVDKGIPIHQSERGTVYRTRMLRVPEHMVSGKDDIFDFLRQMATCEIRMGDGDMVSVRASELTHSEGRFNIWLRLCREKSSSPVIYRKTEDGYENLKADES